MPSLPSIPRLPLVPDLLRRSRIPKDLDAATTTGPEEEPEAGGLTDENVERMWNAGLDLYRSGVHPALQLCVRRHGRVAQILPQHLADVRLRQILAEDHDARHLVVGQRLARVPPHIVFRQRRVFADDERDDGFAAQRIGHAEDGELNRYVNVYVNDEDVRVLDGLDTAVGEGDTLVILPAMAGGA